MVLKFLRQRTGSICEVVTVIGTLLSACPAVKYGWLYTNALERKKNSAVQNNNNNFEEVMQISKSMKLDVLMVATYSDCN